MLIYIFFFLCLKISDCHGAVDPCNNATQLPYMSQRLVNYTLKPGEQAICDRYMKTAWYEMGDYVLANTTDGCGTTYNWYMNAGELPKDGQAFISVCRFDNPIYHCEDEMTIDVKKCGNKFIFHLKSLQACDEAYCIRKLDANQTKDEDAPDISSIQLEIRPDLITLNEYAKELIFYCEFDAIPSTSYIYVVEWSKTTGATTTQLIYRTKAVLYKESEKTTFLSQTALTESRLNQNGIDSLGFMIVCSVTAMKDLAGSLSKPKFSKHKFCGIEVLDRTVTIKDGEDVTVRLRLTVPFHCRFPSYCLLRLEMYIPRVEDECSISEIAQVSNDQIGCGIMFSRGDVGKIKTFQISSKFGKNLHKSDDRYGVLFKTLTYKTHKIFGNYAPDAVRVNMVQDTTGLSGIKCYSHSDPHIFTFDKEWYDNHREGVFVLYRNEQYKTEVQIKTDKCANYYTASWKPTCNCGVAIRTGRDVYMLNKCSSSAWDIGFKYCQDGVMQRSVKKHISGRQFQIKLPTGTEVKVSIGSSFAEVDIIPSLLDKGHTGGLCGIFDEKKDIPTSESKLDLFITSTSEASNSNRNLFNSAAYPNLQPWDREIYLCTCTNPFENAQGDGLAAEAVCKTDAKKRTCKDSYFSDIDDLNICSYERKKRSEDGTFYGATIDRHTSVKTDFQSSFLKLSKEHLISKRSVFTNETAYENCISLMNTTAFQMCSNVPTLSLDSYVDNCAVDALASGSMIWTKLHIEELKRICLRTVEENQPIPADVLNKVEELTASLNFTNDDDFDNSTYLSSSTFGTTTPLNPPDSIFTSSLLESIKSVSCPNDCNGRGKCDDGLCICEEGYISHDCSISENDPPVMKGIPDLGLCDLRQRECQRTSVFGENFVSGTELSCRLTSLVIDASGQLEKQDEFVQNASLQSFEEVTCPLPFQREKRSVSSDIDNYRARGYQVAISNNGKDFSQADVIVIFDTECVACNKTGGLFVCKTKPGFCQSNGMCYSTGDTVGCYICSGESASKWTAGPDCPVPANSPDDKNKKLWIIGATVGPVVAFVVIVAVIFYVMKMKHKATRQKIGSIVSINK